MFRWINGRDPRQYGLDFGLWTRAVMADLIERKLGVRLGVTAVGALLAKLGLTPQKPLQRAYQRDPDAIEQWQRERFPAIARQARAAGGEVWFWDEPGSAPGLGYDRLREINPRIVYVQQSGMGQIGTYGRLRSFGPTAQAFSGLSDMSGLPGPYPPAGIGYSYLDGFGAYQMALAMMAALYRQRVTGQGCWIDSSQAEVGIYLTGASILDHSAKGRSWARYGNRSPYKPTAPHGAYRARGEDRWIAIAPCRRPYASAMSVTRSRPRRGAETTVRPHCCLRGRRSLPVEIGQLTWSAGPERQVGATA